MKNYAVVYYNYNACQTQVWEVLAENEFRAGRAFYRTKKARRGCIETIHEIAITRERELLRKILEAYNKLDMTYCTVLNRGDFSLGMTGEEYEELEDISFEVGEYLYGIKSV
jgi:hypothetical protein